MAPTRTGYEATREPAVVSLPVELEALDALLRGKARTGFNVLLWGLQHDLQLLQRQAAGGQTHKRPNYRLLDLAAGFAIRYRFTKALNAVEGVMGEMRRVKGLSQAHVARLDQMALKWTGTARVSRWRERRQARVARIRWSGFLLPRTR
ncbi:MAG: hypothetical protein V3V08_22000 [Nannocystaceae bacterium]